MFILTNIGKFKIDVLCPARKTVFDFTSKHQEENETCDEQRSISDEIRGV